MSAMEHKITVQGDDAPSFGTDDVLRLSADEPQPKAAQSFLDEMAAQYDDILSGSVELKLPVPFWNRQLVATFTIPSDGASDRLLAAVRATEGGRKEKERVAVCSQLAEACVALHYKGMLLDEHTGFGPNAARALRAPAGATQADLVWLAVREELEVLGRFAVRVQKWMEDPVSKDESQVDDPFDGE